MPTSAEVSRDEHEPLLKADIPEQPYLVVLDVSPEDGVEDQCLESTPRTEPEITGTDTSFHVALMVLALVSLALLGLLIKGLLDAGDVKFDFGKALRSALGGGLSGAAAMVLQVLTLMPLRTLMNYQYRYGTDLRTAKDGLYASRGIARFYDGIGAALIQAPVARFFDTAADAGIRTLLQSNPYMNKLPSPVKTVFASVTAAACRMILTPVDTVKTTLQTEGSRAWTVLRVRVRNYGLSTMWYGSWATVAATLAGHYPWYGTYDYLDATLPLPDTLFQKLGRQALIGFCASVISDTVSNSLRVVKTYRQVNETRIGYSAAARAVIAADGVQGLFGRGLKTRILANGLQGLMFSVLWRLFMDL